ncbi:MAG: hypothetical protein MUC71_03265 [Steroidobacteraceae bacterium]|nr:hypothetical protein [Steroidobacteraceae bacterium]
MSDRAIPERRSVKAALRAAGLSARQTDALLRGGWSAVCGQAQAERDELEERLARLESFVAVETIPPDA